MRKIDKIIWHCSATRPDWFSGKSLSEKVAEIKRWHLRRKFNDIGYHWLIDTDGSVAQGRAEDVQGAHTKGKNRGSIGICYIGGVDTRGRPKDTRTRAQKAALYDLTSQIIERHNLSDEAVHGHNEFAAKACPCFDAQADWAAYLDGKADTTDPSNMPDIGPIGSVVWKHDADIEAIKAWIEKVRGAEL